MSEEKRETKQALLGELESIKDLLSEDEWDDIPLLSDTVVEPAARPSSSSAATNTEPTSERDTESPEAHAPQQVTDTQPDPVDQQLDLMNSADQHPPVELDEQVDEFALAAAAIDASEASAPDSRDVELSDGNQGISNTHNVDIDNAVDKLDLDLSLAIEDDYIEAHDDDYIEAHDHGDIEDHDNEDGSIAGDETDHPNHHSGATHASVEATIDAIVDDIVDVSADVSADEADEALTGSDIEEISGHDTEETCAESTDTSSETSATENAEERTEDHEIDSHSSEATQDHAQPQSVEDRSDIDLTEPLASDDDKPPQAAEDLDKPQSSDAYSDTKETLEHDLEALIHDLDDDCRSPENPEEASDDSNIDLAANENDTITPALDAPPRGDECGDTILIDAPLADDTPKVIDEYQHDAFPELTDSTLSDSTLFASLSRDYGHDHSSTAGESNREKAEQANEDRLPHGVLPGQQSLFTGESRPSKTDGDEPYVRPERPTRATGENPFLPKHIRDRLHTNKALVDIIKETPLPQPSTPKAISEQVHDALVEQLPSQLSSERVQHLVDDVIALYMPRIEAELRERLLVELRRVEPDEEEKPDEG